MCHTQNNMEIREPFSSVFILNEIDKKKNCSLYFVNNFVETFSIPFLCWSPTNITWANIILWQCVIVIVSTHTSIIIYKTRGHFSTGFWLFHVPNNLFYQPFFCFNLWLSDKCDTKTARKHIRVWPNSNHW